MRSAYKKPLANLFVGGFRYGLGISCFNINFIAHFIAHFYYIYSHTHC